MRVDGKRILIMEGGGGLGRAVAPRLAPAGARIVIADIDVNLAQKTAVGLPHAAAIGVDVMSRVSVNGAFASAGERLSGLGVMIYSVGAARHGKPRRVVGRGLGARRRGQSDRRPSLPPTGGLDFRRQGGRGSIIAIPSVAANGHGSEDSIYSASRAGIAAFVHVIAVDLAPLGVRANVVNPGPMNTDPVRLRHSSGRGELRNRPP